jgi:hypothetical protein
VAWDGSEKARATVQLVRTTFGIMQNTVTVLRIRANLHWSRSTFMRDGPDQQWLRLDEVRDALSSYKVLTQCVQVGHECRGTPTRLYRCEFLIWAGAWTIRPDQWTICPVFRVTTRSRLGYGRGTLPRARGRVPRVRATFAPHGYAVHAQGMPFLQGGSTWTGDWVCVTGVCHGL